MKKTKKQLALYHPIYWPAWFGFSILWLITRLPLRLQYFMGAFFGFLLYHIPTKLRPITETNIKLCFPELTPQDQQSLVRKNFRSLGIGIIETAMAWWASPKKLNHRFRVNGIEHLEEAFAKGKGVVLMGPHFTCLEMIARLLGSKYSFAVMYRPHKKPLISFLQERFRNKTDIEHIPRHRVRNLLRVLENQRAIWYAYDVDAGEKGSVFAPLFNIPTASLTAVSRIVAMSGAAVVPISFHRSDDDLTYEVTLSSALENFPSQSYIEDATRLNKIVEAAIREHAEQYVWQYKRFKTRPKGEPRLY